LLTKQKCDASSSITDATLKYFEIVMIQDLNPEKNKALIGDMVPFAIELRKVVLNLNQKLLDLDRDISSKILDANITNAEARKKLRTKKPELKRKTNKRRKLN